MSDDIVRDAFARLFPEKSLPKLSMQYSGRFSGYRGNIRYNKYSNELSVGLSKKWANISKEIQVGIVQSLMCKIFREKKMTWNMELYSNFIRALPEIIPKDRTEPLLESSFNRINSKYFGGLLDKPNLVFSNGTNLLGYYDFTSDTVSISQLLLQDPELLDYVMFHELLHKEQKFSLRPGRQVHHSSAFRKREQSFANHQELEKRLQQLVSKAKRRKVLLNWL